MQEVKPLSLQLRFAVYVGIIMQGRRKEIHCGEAL